MDRSIKILNELEINPLLYLKKARAIAKSRGYNPLSLELANDGKHKLSYAGIKFGSAVNNDFIIYTILKERGFLSKEDIIKKRDAYRARARQVMLNTNDDESPASLSYYILW